MKKVYVLFIISLISQLAIGQIDPNLTDRIHVDQFGYLPESSKVAVISDPQTGFNSNASYSPGNTFELINAMTGESVFSDSPEIWNGGGTHNQSGDRGWWFDFSSIVEEGTYYILDVENNARSYEFKIENEVYQEVIKSATKMFYYNRCNSEKLADYAGPLWEDGLSFENDLQDFNSRYVYDQDNSALEKDLSGGWFDAGDYNKYVTFAMDPIHNLLTAYEDNPSVFADDWNIPESGNNIPDLLDEVKWELDWLNKMTNADGSVHIKMGSISYGHNGNNPPSENYDPRYYGPTCSSASIAVAGMFAHAAKVFSTIENMATYAEELESTAISCWEQVEDRLSEGNLDLDCDDGTIKAGDADLNFDSQYEYALVAAIHLYELTGDEKYNDFVEDHLGFAEMIQIGWWGGYKVVLAEALLYYTTLSGAKTNVVETIISSITPHVEGDWNGFFGFNEDDLYRAFIPTSDYVWGSNMIKSNYGLLNQMILKYGINPSENESYIQKAEEQIHYFHGVNPLGLVMLSNMYEYGAEVSANEIYHTWFADGSIYDHALDSPNGPAPGFLVGGPNVNYTNPNLSPPFGQPAQKSYLEFNPFTVPENAWEITEPGIYYQAAYIRLLAAYVPEIESETPTCETFDLNDFEDTWGIWIDGGADASRANRPEFANTGNYALMIKDNTSSSIITTQNIDLESAASLILNFNFITTGFSKLNEEFWLQISTDGGLSFNTVEDWTYEQDFTNDNRVFETLEIAGPFSNQTQLRFRSNASGNSDKVYLDDIEILSCGLYEATCDDGVQNGDETGIDCGGANCPDCDFCSITNFNDVELSWDIWNDGGDDAARSNNVVFANSGTYSFMIKDNTSSSTITTSDLALDTKEELLISFNFITTGFNSNHQNFVLEISTDGGNNYSLIKEWHYLNNFNNNSRVFENVNIEGPFSDHTRIRFRCDATGNNDKVYIDDIQIEVCGSSDFITTSIESRDKASSLSINVFPNPVLKHSNINISFRGQDEAGSLSIHNSTGQLMFTAVVDSNQDEISISTKGFEHGVYTIVFNNKRSMVTQKIIVL